jgi:HTH-type transcriptional regulator/antitoxin HipB
MQLAENVRVRRRELGLTQTDTAQLAGVSERFVRLVESGKESIRLDKLTALLDVLGLELRVTMKIT